MDWKQELSQSITTPGDLPGDFSLLPGERAFFNRIEEGSRHSSREHVRPLPLEQVLPFRVTPYYFSLIDPARAGDPVRKQCFPLSDEFNIKEYEDMDPLYEKDFESVPSLVHRYKNRVLLRVTGQCATYCRHCFRRFAAGQPTGARDHEFIDRVTTYIASHPEVDEILISGGDPFVLDDDRLFTFLHSIRVAKKNAVLRLCTRAPVVLPSRLTIAFSKALAAFSPVWVVTQFNHPRELTDQSREAIIRLTSRGIPVLNQTVLLRGINDDPGILYTLFQGLVRWTVKPYYLFQGDLACGTSHFRVNLETGIDIYNKLKKRVSGLALPRFSLDLPRGGGKTILSSFVYKRKGKWYLIKDYNGNEYYYPVEHNEG